MMGFDIDKMAHKVTSPFLGRLEAVEKKIEESNDKLERVIELLEILAEDK